MNASIPKPLSAVERYYEEYKYPGFTVTEFYWRGKRLYFDLRRKEAPICPDCGKPCKIHSVKCRTVHDVPHSDEHPIVLRVFNRIVRCTCGCRKAEPISWLEPKARVTNALVAAIQVCMRDGMTVSATAKKFALSWPTVKECDKTQLEYFFSDIDPSNVRHLAIDEFLLHKGHRYATVVMDIETAQVLHVCVGKSQEAIEPFFDWLREKGVIDQIETVSCDMNAAYPSMFEKHIPDVKIIYDLFHVVKNFKEVLKAARIRCVELLNQQKKDKEQAPEEEEQLEFEFPVDDQPVKPSLRKAEWLLLTRPDDLEVDRKELLDRMLADNEILASLAPMAQMIREIWTTKKPTDSILLVKKLRELLLEVNERFEFNPAKKFADMLDRRLAGIVYAGQYGFTTNRLEGANNKIKTERRKAYGFRDLKYFFLRIKAALPGIRNSPWSQLGRSSAILKSGIWKGLAPDANPLFQPKP